jgi:cytochrome c-type biogenesis protein
MGAGSVLWDGFSSFFSIWQICILQVSPFFIAYMTGLFLVTRSQKTNPGIRQWVILPCIAYAIGFTIFYSLLIASGLSISRPLIFNIGNLRVISGIVILCAALYILLVNRISLLNKLHSPLLVSALSLLIGSAFAIMYSPCITPTLSDIMGLASQRGTAVEGWYLAFCYGLGICIALTMTVVTLILILRKREIVLQNIGLIKTACGMIVLVPALLNIAGMMRHYKAFVLGFLV